MIEQLSAIQQRRLAIGILASLVAAVLTITILPVSSTNASYETRIDLVERRLQSLRADVAAYEELRPRIEQLRQSQVADGHYLRSSTEAVAAAELQSIANRISASNGTQLLTTQILPARQEGDFVRIALKVRMRGDLEGFIQSIYDIESSPTFLFMDNVSVRNSARQGTNRQAAGNQFDADFQIIGFMPGTANED